MSARTSTSWRTTAGIGFNTPTIIRFPFERMAASYPDVTLLRINKDYRDCLTPGIMHFIGLETI